MNEKRILLDRSKHMKHKIIQLDADTKMIVTKDFILLLIYSTSEIQVYSPFPSTMNYGL